MSLLNQRFAINGAKNEIKEVIDKRNDLYSKLEFKESLEDGAMKYFDNTRKLERIHRDLIGAIERLDMLMPDVENLEEQ